LNQDAIVAAAADFSVPHQFSRKKERHEQTLKNFKDMQYSAVTVVGGQEMDGILDTGSFELLVFSQNCTTCGKVNLFYNGSESSEHEIHPENITTMHSYGSGDAWSTLAYDRVALGPLSVEKQYFWEVTAANLPILNIHNSFQAIVGVGPIATAKKAAWDNVKALRVAENVAGVADNTRLEEEFGEEKDHALILTQQKPLLENLDCNIFSVCFRRGKGEPGSWVWNDDDPSQDPKFTKVDVIGRVHWGVNLTTVGFSGGKGDSHLSLACGSDEQSCAAVVDSGTSVFAVPTEVANKAFDLLNGVENVSCEDISEFPNFVFELGGKTFSLPPESYIMEIEGQLPLGPFGYIPLPLKLCTLGFITLDMMTDHGPMWIVGMPFFREYYTTFHLGDDPWNHEARSLYTAHADDDCRPEKLEDASGTALIQKRRPAKKPRRIDLSKLAIPLWLREGATRGYMDL
jgi:hypothetical protein